MTELESNGGSHTTPISAVSSRTTVPTGYTPTATEVARSQFIYHDPYQDTYYGVLPAEVVQTFTNNAPEYCSRLDLIHILRGRTYDGTDTCTSGTELPTISSEDYDVTDELGADGCHRPPTNLEAQWCSVNAACEDSAAGDCASYQAVCVDDGGLVVPTSADEGLFDDGAAGSGGSSSGDNSLCSVTAIGSGRVPGWLLLATTLMLVAGRRRRRP